MQKIIFDSFLKVPGKITFHAKSYDGENFIKQDELFFEFSENISVNDNLIAIVICTFCKNLYGEIYFDLVLNKKTLENISEYTGANVSSKQINDDECYNKQKHNISLNFSGGFDSLAAKILLGNLVELVAINFTGEGFKREYEFFKKFNPYTITTNFRQLGYSNERNDWTFMGVASILYSDYLNLDYQIFGTIFEASPYHGIKEYSSRENYVTPPFNYAGLSDLKIVQGLTEIGTALVLCNTQPHLINDSLISLSTPGSEKRYRKQFIIQILVKKFKFKNIFIELTEPPSQDKIRSWGSNFALDFLALYFLKNAGFDETSKTVKDIPEGVLTFVENHSLEFYEKYDTNFLNNVPIDIKSTFIKNLSESGIYPFNEQDFIELSEVMNLLGEFYPNIKKLYGK